MLRILSHPTFAVSWGSLDPEQGAGADTTFDIILGVAVVLGILFFLYSSDDGSRQNQRIQHRNTSAKTSSSASREPRAATSTGAKKRPRKKQTLTPAQEQRRRATKERRRAMECAQAEYLAHLKKRAEGQRDS